MRELIQEFSPRVVVMDMSAVALLEYTALRMLMDGEEKMRDLGVTLWLVGLNPEVLEVVRNSNLWARLGRERMLYTLEQAVEVYLGEGGGTRPGTE